MVTANIDREKATRCGLNISDVQDMDAIATDGCGASTMFGWNRRFDIIIRLPEHLRLGLEVLKRLPIPLAHAGANGPLSATSYIP